MRTYGKKPPLQQVSKLNQTNKTKKPGQPGQRNNDNSGNISPKELVGNPGLRKLNSKFSTKFISEAGSKLRNKDYFAFVELDNFACWAIAESYDNDPYMVSAQMAVTTVLDMFTSDPTLSKKKLKSYIREAHKKLRLQSGKYQLKASIMIVATNYKRMRYAHCGNCRLHIFRGNNIFLRSHDQSLYQEMIDREDIPDDGYYGMEESRNLFDFLGKQGRVNIDISPKIILYDEDILLLTTWGFWEKISTVEMLDALESAQEPMDYLEELQDLFLSKQDRSVNNYTLATIFAMKTFQEKDNTKKYIKIALAIGIPVLVASVVLSVYLYRSSVKRNELIAYISEYEDKGDVYIKDENYDRALVEYDSAIGESKDLKETKGRKGEQNNEIKEELNSKQRVAQLIIDANELFKDGKYDEAKSNYEKALKEAKQNMDFYDEQLNTENLETQIALCDDYQYIDDLVALADSQAALGQYNKAIANYDEARQLANSTKNKEAQQDIKLKSDEVESKLQVENDKKTEEEKAKEQEKYDKKLKDIQNIELNGDKAVMANDYAKGISYYNQAATAYTGLGDMDKTTAVNAKIIDANARKKEEEDKKIEEEEAKVQEGIDNIIKDAQNIELSGDKAVVSKDYATAIELYNQAATIYTGASSVDKAAAVTAKIIDVNSKIKQDEDTKVQEETDKKINAAKEVELNGDRSAIAKNYTKAIDYYDQAALAYTNAGDMDKVSSVNTKIANLNEKMQQEEEDRTQEEIDKIIKEGETIELDGDRALLSKDYDLAIDYYNSAAGIYAGAGDTAKASDANQKIDDVYSKIQADADKKLEEEEAFIQDQTDTKIKQGQAIELDGDKALLTKNYANAISKYNEASSIYIDAGDMDKVYAINSKIDNVYAKMDEEEKADLENQINEIVRHGQATELEGDKLLLSRSYDDAISKYNEAAGIYTDAGDMDKVYAVNAKIDNIYTKMDEEQKNVIQSQTNELIKQGQSIELDGDKALLTKNYEDAINKYNEASNIYIDAGDMDKVYAVNTKIDNVYTRMDDEEKAVIQNQTNEIVRQGQLVELEGDKALISKDYDLAIDKYSEAAGIYINVEDMEKANAVNKKIDDINLRITQEEEEAVQNQILETQKQVDDKIKEAETLELDADGAASQKYYEIAKDMYQRAKDAYTAAGATDKATSVNNKLISLDTKIQQDENDSQGAIAESYISEGDNYMLVNNFDKAIESYKKAKDLYSTLQNVEKVNNINNKITTAESKKTEANITAKRLEIDKIETEGDNHLKNRDYKDAIENYRQAQTLYRGINDLDKVEALQEKIKSVNEIMSGPTVTAS